MQQLLSGLSPATYQFEAWQEKECKSICKNGREGRGGPKAAPPLPFFKVFANLALPSGLFSFSSPHLFRTFLPPLISTGFVLIFLLLVSLPVF